MSNGQNLNHLLRRTGKLVLAAETTRAAGIVVVVSAGNSGWGCGSVESPAAIYEASFSVGATDSSDAIADFSSRGPVTVDGSGSSDVDEDELSYAWSFVSVPPGSTATLSDPTGPTATFVADAAGIFASVFICNLFF